MNNEKDYLDEILEYDENEISNVELNTIEINEIKSKVLEVINGLKKRNKKLDFNLSINEVNDIVERLGQGSMDSIYGIKHAKLMKELVIKTIEEEHKIKKEEVIDEVFVTIPQSFFWYSSVTYYKLYLTKDSLSYYGFNVDYTLVTNGVMKIYEILEAGSEGDGGWMSQEQLVIKSRDVILSFYTLHDYERKELVDFIQVLEGLGVKEAKKIPTKWVKIVMPLLYISIAIGMIYLLWLGVSR